MTDPPCEHRVITTWTSDNATVAMWACAECSRRFYPACSVCVSVGHRNIVHHPGEAVVAALHELGVPDDTYPAPVANAVSILRAELDAALTPEDDR